MRVTVTIHVDDDGIRGYGAHDELDVNIECVRDFTDKSAIKIVADAAAAKALAAVEASA